MIPALRRLAMRLGYSAHQPAHRLNSKRRIPPHRMLRPTTQPLPIVLPRHRADDRIQPEAWWNGGASA